MSALYSTELLALAANIPHAGRLEEADGSATLRSPVCGSTVTVDVRMTDGRVTAFAQQVNACLMGQASAALMGERHHEDLVALRDAVAAMLAGGAIVPGYEALAPAREVPARHAAILLPLDTAIAAMEKSRQR
ncbi:iron-sulfur cluster assembly scaffold protein [Falsirhodobacter sp. 20TX0035]|uniref:iron-sulfur cluster assembly scaffold protein n=1 Tax=Falsirhodobacter sp. 20TX0035 TaxID=3022019 RepID=UPI00232CD33A|nr:iron-sulfur cluster assembly scaffold protein [Falsirhodobacter sp. 20TX0035]MDB6453396.1 iron-sulfur cluster assembly scaffold protein [Falsirhodobacter sp. 20TX0035]